MGPVHNVDHVDFEILDWVPWLNNHPCLEPIGDIPDAGVEELHYQSQEAQEKPVRFMC